MPNFITVFGVGAGAPQINAALDAIDAAGGQVTQAWGNFVLIGQGDDGVPDALRGLPGIAAATVDAIPDIAGLDIDPMTGSLAAMWNYGQSPAYQSEMDRFANPDLPGKAFVPRGGCNNGTKQPSGILNTPINPFSLLGYSPSGRAGLTLQHPDRRALVGTIGVPILMIDGKDGTSTVFTPTEWQTALAAIKDGLDRLSQAAPAAARLVFQPVLFWVKLNVDPSTVILPADRKNPTVAEFESMESKWRDPALQFLNTNLGLQLRPGRAGYRDLVSQTPYLFKIDWGYVIVITKYSAAWPAYAPDYRDVVISYPMVPTVDPSLGMAALPVIVAHETGHTTDANDEYGPDCTVFDRCGWSHTLNGNCSVDNPFAQPCIMDHGVTTPCTFTVTHFGWGDQNLDGVLDPYDPTFVIL